MKEITEIKKIIRKLKIDDWYKDNALKHLDKTKLAISQGLKDAKD